MRSAFPPRPADRNILRLFGRSIGLFVFAFSFSGPPGRPTSTHRKIEQSKSIGFVLLRFSCVLLGSLGLSWFLSLSLGFPSVLLGSLGSSLVFVVSLRFSRVLSGFLVTIIINNE